MSSPEELRGSLSVSWKEGIPANVMLSILDYYLVPFALFLGATPVGVGFVVAVPHLLASASQLLAVRVVAKAGSRLRFLVDGARLQAAFVLPLCLLPLLGQEYRIPLLVALASIFRVLMQLMGTAWGSLMSDYLQPEERGRYLGWRSRVVGIAGVFGLGLAGLMLHYVGKFSNALGFGLLFLWAAACRALSSHLLSRMADLPSVPDAESEFTLLMFLGRFRESNFVKFVAYVSGITFAAQLAAPYFMVYMLRDLGFDYLSYTAVHLAAVLGGIISFPIWGRHADRVGNVKVLKTTGALVPVVPLLWIPAASPGYLVAVEFFAGFVWAGFTLSSANFVYDAVTPEKRVRCLGYFNLIAGIAVSAGASLGGHLAEGLPPLFGYRLLTLMALSSLLRLAVHLLFSGKFSEVRGGVERTSSSELFLSVLGIRPVLGRNRELNVLPPMPGKGRPDGTV